MPLESAISYFLHECGGVAVIDGGHATDLECHGADLNDPLWNAKCILISPHLICTATILGFEHKGYSREESKSLLTKSIEIAREERDVYYNRCRESLSDHAPDNRILKQQPILVAASVGSYGAYLVDGSEYSGDYGNAMDMEFIKNFHRRKVQVLADSGPDLIAFETVPNKLEAQAFAQLLDEEEINIPAWLSFSS